MFYLALFLCERAGTHIFNVGPHVVTYAARDRVDFERTMHEVIVSMMHHKGLALFVSGPGIDGYVCDATV